MSLKKVLSLKNLYLVKSSLDSKVLFTPLSQQIKQNIANEWIKCNRQILPMGIFVSPRAQNWDPINNCRINYLKLNYKKYHAQWYDPTSQPIGVIESFICGKDMNAKNFLDSNGTDCLLFALFSPKQQSLQLFNKIQVIHNHWFKNLARSPLKSEFNMVQCDQDNIECIINYKIEGIDQTVEELVYFGDSIAEKKLGITDWNLISCKIDLDNTLLSLLCDAFTQYTNKSQNYSKKMKLNSSIAPFKIAFTFRTETEINEQMIEITKYMIEMLNEFEIPIFPFFTKKLPPIERSVALIIDPLNIFCLKSYDELGIPLTVIIDSENIQKGVIALRNRDTDTQELLHISSFQKTVCLYLKVIHPTKVRNKIFN